MNISSETLILMNELAEFSGSKLKDIDKLSVINEIAAASGSEKLYYDLQFTAKYVNGLSKILQDNLASIQGKENPNQPAEGSSPQSKEEAAEKIKKEFKTNILRFTELLGKLLKYANEDTRNEFEKKYLSLTRDSMLNLNTLIYDLSWLKKYNNSKRS